MAMNSFSKLLCLLGLGVLQTGIALAQSNTAEVVRGPLYSGTIRGPKSNEAIAMKGLVIALGPERKAYVCYDADLLRLSLAWTGPFLEFGNTQTQITWPPPPQVKGAASFGTKTAPGWSRGGSFADSRPGKQGPLPKDWAHYRGLYVNGDQVVLAYTVGKCNVLELPEYESQGGLDFFSRTLNLSSSKEPLSLMLCDIDAVTGQADEVKRASADGREYIVVGKDKRMAVGLVGGPAGAQFTLGKDDLRLTLPAGAKTTVKLVLCRVANFDATQRFEAYLKKAAQPADLASLCKGGAARWTEAVVTKGVRGAGDEPYVVDTITEPAANPWNAKTFFGGFDFLSDGRAAMCTFHGDVWLVSGIDESLEKLTWKRFATGLFQPLGLKVVKDTIYVLGRDQITALHDLNKNGEADYYENFNNDSVVTANYHEFSLDLHTDRAGNFYYAKGAPWEPAVTSPHQGCLLKVSKDGGKLEVFATGFRAPNGMTIGPRDEITVSDNQGHWMPSSKLDWVQKGGFYGMTPAAQRELRLTRGGTNFLANPSDPEARAKFNFKGWNEGSPQPEGYDLPIAWLPQSMDNSSGGQVWVTGDKWGPLKDRLLFMSYGKCTLFEVMTEEVDGVKQAAMIQFPLKFNSGLMRGRVNPRDGQVYVAGLKGWQTSGTKDGGFYRVRYTGKPVRLPTEFHATTEGVRITFSCALDAKAATDAANYNVERWTYVWSGVYGSPEFSVNEPGKKKHDALEVKSARLLPDGKTLVLQIDDMKPADQMRIKYSINAADGAPISQEIYNTVYKLGR
jgi:hypothetical protein